MTKRLRVTGWRATIREGAQDQEERPEAAGAEEADGTTAAAAARSGAGAPAASSAAGADCCLEVPFWSIGGVQLPSRCAIKLSKACGRS